MSCRRVEMASSLLEKSARMTFAAFSISDRMDCCCCSSACCWASAISLSRCAASSFSGFAQELGRLRRFLEGLPGWR